MYCVVHDVEIPQYMCGGGWTLLAGDSVSGGMPAGSSDLSLVQTVQQVKHGLGDLKAEWLLMRRDIQEARLDAGSLRVSQSAIKDDTARLKAVIDLVKTETGRMKAQIDQLMSHVNKLQSNVRSSCCIRSHFCSSPRYRLLYSARFTHLHPSVCLSVCLYNLHAVIQKNRIGS